MNTLLGIFARYPRAGAVKTRLARAIGAVAAAELYEAMLLDLIDRFASTAARRVLGFACEPADHPEATSYFARVAPTFERWEQPTGTLGQRMRAFFAEHLSGSGAADRVVLVGSDAVTLPASAVERAFAFLEVCDCVVGPAADGGYYLLGMSRLCDEAFGDAIPWSTSRVLAETARRLQSCGRRMGLLPVQFDVDTAESLDALAGYLEASRACEDAFAEACEVNVPRRTAFWLRSHGYLS